MLLLILSYNYTVIISNRILMRSSSVPKVAVMNSQGQLLVYSHSYTFTNINCTLHKIHKISHTIIKKLKILFGVRQTFLLTLILPYTTDNIWV